MLNGTVSRAGYLTIIGVVVLILLPLILLACGSEEATERPKREPRDRAAEERGDERTEAEREERSEPRSLIGGMRREGSVETDREALEALYRATGGDNWRNNDNWLTGAPLGEWYGIGTHEEGRVVSIDLWQNGLEGEIPPEIGSLDRLLVLEINYSRLTGPIPRELEFLSSLEVLSLGDNRLTDDFPHELARLSNLKSLSLAGNELSGEIPRVLGNLSSLEALDLSRNHLSGEIPSQLSRLERLTILWLNENKLTGWIPPALGNLEDLEQLDLSYNQLSGEIPEELSGLASLRVLHLAGNRDLTGCVSSVLAPRLDPRSELGNVPICGGLALGAQEATEAPWPTAAPQAVATEAPTSPRGPTATRPWPTPTWPPPTAAPTAVPEATSVPVRATPTPAPTWAPTATPYPQATAAPAPTRVPAATAVPAATFAPVSTPTMAQAGYFNEYARQHAGGPRAIYVGDLRQLVGPAPLPELGDRNGKVPLDALQRHAWIYESDYYRELLAKASLTNPTQLTSRGERITIRFACINRSLLPCRLMETYFAPNLQDRTDGQVEFVFTYLAELGLAGPDALTFLVDGTLDAASVYGGYLSWEFPALDIITLYGGYSSSQESYQAMQSIIPDLDLIIEEVSSGGVIFSHSWNAGQGQFLFCRDAIESAMDFRGKRISSDSASLLDWVGAMGGDPQFLGFAELFTAIERGFVDCAMSDGNSGYSQLWHWVADYVMGPLYSLTAQSNTINRDIWNSIPADLQQIILEEGAKLELEALRLASIQNEVGLTKLQDAGMDYIPFSTEMRQLIRQATFHSVIPQWLSRVGDASDPIITDTFNRKVGPIVGMRIERDGTVIDLR